MKKFSHYWHKYGFLGLLVRSYQKFWPIQKSYVYQTQNYSEYVAARDLQIKCYKSYGEIGEELWGSLIRQGQQHLRNHVQKTFQPGHELWLGFLPGGRLAGVCWSSRDQQRNDYFVPVQREEATIFSCWVLEPFRGRGIYPSMLKRIINTYMESGVKRIYIDCKKWNRPSVRGIEKVGFDYLGSAWRLKVRSWSIVLARSWQRQSSYWQTPYGRRGVMLRCLYLTMAGLWWIGSGLGRFGRRGAVILCYHAILPPQQEAFRRQMRHIRNRTVRPDRLPPKGIRLARPLDVCVTFDDAFVCLREHALPAMREYGIRSTIFVPVENLDRPPRWSMPEGHPERGQRVCSGLELQSLLDGELLMIGSHSCTHPDLSRIDSEQARYELEGSKRQLESILGRAVQDFALPHGRYNASTLKIAEEVGYERVYTLEPRVARRGERVLGRFLMSPDAWDIEFKLTAAGAYQWLYLVRKWVHALGLR